MQTFLAALLLYRCLNYKTNFVGRVFTQCPIDVRLLSLLILRLGLEGPRFSGLKEVQRLMLQTCRGVKAAGMEKLKEFTTASEEVMFFSQLSTLLSRLERLFLLSVAVRFAQMCLFLFQWIS